MYMGEEHKMNDFLNFLWDNNITLFQPLQECDYSKEIGLFGHGGGPGGPEIWDYIYELQKRIIHHYFATVI